ncbi:radical SAM family heme chaperone HemW [Fuchsiella alkaliacetigena]|uniref:radical SAM family heme chaperone HemW n=1 Tax=Fuchsiella alkaliacetigena TaxID=957042 RepID=UPI00200B702D|nr:radical SAM family heme chaperone HemW [Fuchsiella alkaliacetigena]MCK8825145.1 radical SAM family heme chaperone HemW [Fuchsiella alkaliacetigena]
MNNSFGLYIHIPFCISKCYYCDYNSVLWEPSLVKEYLAALQEELKLLAAKYEHPRLKTIFIGGGTPSSLTGEQIYQLLLAVNKEFQVSTELEVSLEANPDTVNSNKLAILKEAGINRLSLGVQSFNNNYLQSLGRAHTRQEAIDSYYLAREIGFKNINLDLLFAVPGQSLADWELTLKRAVQLRPEHLSTYSLEIVPGTVFELLLEKGSLDLVSEQLDRQLYERAIELFLAAGYEHYEICSFARPNYSSEHNQLYWQGQPYLALGAGVHFFDGEVRGRNVNSLSSYLSYLEQGKLPLDKVEVLTMEDKIVAKMILGLNLRDGISLVEFAQEFDKELTDLYSQEITKLKQLGLIKINDNRIALSRQGLLMANDVLAEFIL